MPYVFNPFSGSLDNAPSTFKGDSSYTTLQSASTNWDNSYSTVQSNSATWLTNSYLSTNNITISALTVISTISAMKQIYFDEHQAIKTTTTNTPGISAVTKIVSVSALPLIQEVNTLYILI